MSEPNNNDKNSIDGMYVCMAVVGLIYFFGMPDEKGIFLRFVAAIVYGPIVGFFAYFLGLVMWMVFSGVVQEANESAKSKGIPAPFALLWGIIVGIGALYLFMG